MGVGSALSSLSTLSSPPLYAQHLVYLVYLVCNCTIAYCTVAIYSAMSSMFSKWRSESASPWASVYVSNCTRVLQAAKQCRRGLFAFTDF